jgi:hypothetical protein
MRICGAHRPLLAAAALLVAAFLAGGCGGGAADPGPAAPPTATFSNADVSFRHPAPWKAHPFTWRGELHFHPMLYLSTQPVRDPCRTQGQTVTCGWPVERLRPGGVLVSLENRGAPGWSIDAQPGTAFAVGGRAAKRRVYRPGACGAIGGQATVDVVVASPLPDNWTELVACLRGPRLAANEQRVQRLLASLRFR